MDLPGFTSQAQKASSCRSGSMPLNFKMNDGTCRNGDRSGVLRSLTRRSRRWWKRRSAADPGTPAERPELADLTLLSPGSRVNATGLGLDRCHQQPDLWGLIAGRQHRSVSAQRRRSTGHESTACTTWGQRSSAMTPFRIRDGDQPVRCLTAGRLSVQVNAVTKAGTNPGARNAAGLPRASFNSPDFIACGILFSDQQGSVTFAARSLRQASFLRALGCEQPEQLYLHQPVSRFQRRPGFTSVLSKDNKWGGRGL